MPAPPPPPPPHSTTKPLPDEQPHGGADHSPQDQGTSAAAGRDPTPWPALLAAMVAPFLPTHAARRSPTTRLPTAYAIHLVAALAGVVVVFAAVAATRAVVLSDGRFTVGEAAVQTQAAVDSVRAEFRRRPKNVLLVAGTITLLVELGFVTAALTAMPWGARDEPLRDSVRHALRRVWLQTPHATLCIAIAGAQVAILAWIKTNYRSRLPPMEEFVIPPTWALVVTSGLWFFLALLRAAGTRREVAPIDRPPHCEQCGYNLSMIPMESRCPECGEAVAASLGADARPGTPWERRHQVGRWTAYRACFLETLLKPTAFGRKLRVTGHTTSHRSFLWIHLPVIFVMGAAAIGTAFGIMEGASELVGHLYVSVFVGIAVGAVCVGGAVSFTASAASSIGVKHTLREKRNLLPGVVQMACYLSGYMTIWALVGAVVTVTVMVLEHENMFRLIEEHFGFRYGTILPIVWAIPNGAFAVWYFVLLHRGTFGARYANT